MNRTQELLHCYIPAYFYSYAIRRMKCQIITYYFISSRTWQRPNCFPYISWVTSCWVESQGFLTATPDGFYPLQAYDIRRGGGTTATQTNPKQCTKRKYRTGSLFKKRKRLAKSATLLSIYLQDSSRRKGSRLKTPTTCGRIRNQMGTSSYDVTSFTCESISLTPSI